MKKVLLLSLILLTALPYGLCAQNEKGVQTMFNGKIRFCTYEQSYTDFFGKDNITELESLEIACDETVENTAYDIHFRLSYKGTIYTMNLHVTHFTGDEGAYSYTGVDRMSEKDVVVSTKKSLKQFSNNYGVESKEDAVVGSDAQILIIYKDDYKIFNIYPVKNK